MTKERVIEYLEDIKPSRIRLKQLQYTLTLKDDVQPLRAVSYGDKVSTYKIGDTTADTVIMVEDRKMAARADSEELRAKLDLYTEWISTLDEESKKLILDIYEQGHSMEWLAIEKGYESVTIRQRKFRAIEILRKTPIFAVTEIEKQKEKEII